MYVVCKILAGVLQFQSKAKICFAMSKLCEYAKFSTLFVIYIVVKKLINNL